MFKEEEPKQIHEKSGGGEMDIARLKENKVGEESGS